MSAVGCRSFTWLCLGGPGHRAEMRPAGSERSLYAMTGYQSGSTWSLRTEPLQPAPCRPSSKVSFYHLPRLQELPEGHSSSWDGGEVFAKGFVFAL